MRYAWKTHNLLLILLFGIWWAERRILKDLGSEEIVVRLAVHANFKQHLPLVFPLELSSYDFCSQGAASFPFKNWEPSSLARCKEHLKPQGTKQNDCIFKWNIKHVHPCMRSISFPAVGGSVSYTSYASWCYMYVLMLMLYVGGFTWKQQLHRGSYLPVISSNRHEPHEKQCWHDSTCSSVTSSFTEMYLHYSLKKVTLKVQLKQWITPESD